MSKDRRRRRHASGAIRGERCARCFTIVATSGGDYCPQCDMAMPDRTPRPSTVPLAVCGIMALALAGGAGYVLWPEARVAQVHRGSHHAIAWPATGGSVAADLPSVASAPDAAAAQVAGVSGGSGDPSPGAGDGTASVAATEPPPTFPRVRWAVLQDVFPATQNGHRLADGLVALLAQKGVQAEVLPSDELPSLSTVGAGWIVATGDFTSKADATKEFESEHARDPQLPYTNARVACLGTVEACLPDPPRTRMRQAGDDDSSVAH